MKVTILGSNSFGNCYLFEASNGTLIVELGFNFNDIKKGLKFDFSKVVGALMTHEHGDHSKGATEAMKFGVDIYSSRGTFEALELKGNRAKIIESQKIFNIGPFKIFPFNVNHNAKEPLGFIINHPECGNVLFITDTSYVEYKFQNLNHIFLETNYCENVLNSRSIHRAMANRVRRDHMSLQTAKELLNVNDLTNVKNIVLIHLSDGNSDEKRFVSEVKSLTNKNGLAANKGMILNL